MKSYLQKNNSIGIVLLLVNIIAIILYIILDVVMEFFDSEFILSSTFSRDFNSGLITLIFGVAFSYATTDGWNFKSKKK